MFFAPNEEEKFLFYDAPNDFINELMDICEANVKIQNMKIFKNI